MEKLNAYFEQHSSIRSEYLKKSSKILPLINARRLAAIIDHENIDVIHMHWGNDLALAALAKKISARKPALVYTRQMKITRYKTDFYHSFMYSQMDLMLTITRQLESEAKQFIPGARERIMTLYYGVDAPTELLPDDAIRQKRDELGFSEDDFIVGLLGRLEQGKGQHLANDDFPVHDYRFVLCATHTEDTHLRIVDCGNQGGSPQRSDICDCECTATHVVDGHVSDLVRQHRLDLPRRQAAKEPVRHGDGRPVATPDRERVHEPRGHAVEQRHSLETGSPREALQDLVEAGRLPGGDRTAAVEPQQEPRSDSRRERGQDQQREQGHHDEEGSPEQPGAHTQEERHRRLAGDETDPEKVAIEDGRNEQGIDGPAPPSSLSESLQKHEAGCHGDQYVERVHLGFLGKPEDER